MSYKDEITKIIEQDNFRKIYNIEEKYEKFLVIDEKKMINFSSNDYLNLSTNKNLVNEFINKYLKSNEFIFSSTSSRLLTGSSKAYKKLEEDIAKLFKKEASLLFNTGYQCNLGVVSTLVKRGDVIFSDKLNHASIIDGMKLSGCDFYRYKHLDYDNLEEILKKHRQEYKRALIVSETVFSMDGDIANIKKLVELKQKYNAYLMLDEAHAFGVFGNNSAGIADKENLLEEIDIITATLGKSFASMGAFCTANKEIIDYLTNKANSFIFSTAIPPINILWSSFLIEEKMNLIKEKSTKLKKLIQEAHIYIKDKGKTQIIPIVIGDSGKTVKIAQQLQAKGYFVLPVRPPTVPVNTSRFRLSLTSDITINEFKDVINTIKEVLQ